MGETEPRGGGSTFTLVQALVPPVSKVPVFPPVLYLSSFSDMLVWVQFLSPATQRVLTYAGAQKFCILFQRIRELPKETNLFILIQSAQI